MNAALSLLAGMILLQSPEPSTPIPAPSENSAAEPVAPPEQPTPQPAPVVAPPAEITPARHARRASEAPLIPATNSHVARRVLGVVTVGGGAVLVAAGAVAAGFVAFVEYSHWPSTPKPAEYPRHTLSVIGAATAAVCLMFGATCILGGLAALL